MPRRTRMEFKQRLQKRPQFIVAVPPAATPPLSPDDEEGTQGRVPRKDFRGFPWFLGYGPESEFEYI